MFTEKQWTDCTEKQKADYFRVITGVWDESAKARAEIFLDARKPAMLMSGDVIVAPANKDVSRQEFVDLLKG